MQADNPNDEQMLAWEKERQQLLSAVRDGSPTDPRLDLMLDQAADLEAHIAEAPSDSRVAALVKLRTVVRASLCEGARNWASGEQIVTGLISFMEQPETPKRELHAPGLGMKGPEP